MRAQKYVLAIKIAGTPAIAFGTENAIVSETLPARRLSSPEGMRGLLDDVWETLPVSAIYLAKHVGYKRRAQERVECRLRKFAEEKGLPVVEVPSRFYRAPFTGLRNSLSIDVYDEAVRMKMAPQSVSEAETMALLLFAVSAAAQAPRAA